MSWYRKSPLFAAAIAVCALLALGELALIYERFTASRAAARKLDQRKVELQGMGDLTPPPTREVATAIEADLAKAQSAMASMQAELKGRGAYAEKMRATKTPAARTDAYFDLATFVERMRELAKKHDVDVRPEAARFGFAVYVNEGPEVERIEPVFKQRQIAQYLLEALVEAKPRTLLAIRRERTMTKTEREAHAAAIASGEPPPEPDAGEDGLDYFTIDPQVSARVAGYVDTLPFRFVFTGQTAALRTFLNRLASFELPVLVREVEVDTASAEELAAVAPDEAAPAEPAAAAAPSVVLSTDAPADEAPGAAAAKAPAPPRAPRRSAATPIVSKPLSKFTVTVEFVELVPPPATPAEGSAPPPS
jgi:hypothetical protein